MNEKSLKQLAYEYGIATAMYMDAINGDYSPLVITIYKAKRDMLEWELKLRGGHDGEYVRDDLSSYYLAGRKYQKTPEDMA